MDGCFSVYVLNTTEALFLFFKQRNLEGRGSEEERTEIEKEERIKERKRDRKCDAVHGRGEKERKQKQRSTIFKKKLLTNRKWIRLQTNKLQDDAWLTVPPPHVQTMKTTPYI